jgi:hypothetical protein
MWKNGAEAHHRRQPVLHRTKTCVRRLAALLDHQDCQLLEDARYLMYLNEGGWQKVVKSGLGFALVGPPLSMLN